MLRTIKAKIIAFTIPLIIAVFLFPTLFLAHQFKKNFEEKSMDLFFATTPIILAGLERTMIKNEHPDLQQTLEEIGSSDIVSNISIFKRTGEIKFSSKSDNIGLNIKDIYPKMDSVNFSGNKIHKNVFSEKYISWQPIRNSKSCQSCHSEPNTIAFLGMETEFTESERFFYTGSTHIYFLAIVFILVLIGGYYLILNYFLSKPLKRFIAALEEVEQGNLEIALPAETNDEFATLEGHFNRMTKEINSSMKQIEEMHNEQIHRADKLVTLGELAAEMAHEVNNPAAIIMSRADYLLMESEENESLGNFQQDLEVIIGQTENISTITNNILKFSKKLPTDFSEIEISSVLDECLMLLKHRFLKKNISIIQENLSEDCFIFGDSQQLQQVFTNLLNNAIDAIGSDGKIEIKILKENSKVRVTVSDNGPGMDITTQEKIYLPFFTNKGPSKGTGLGLYVVKNILHKHNATIECISEPGKGSIFHITFNGLGKR